MEWIFLDASGIVALLNKSDCISFELMKEYGCTQAFTDDHHFQQAGFIVLIL